MKGEKLQLACGIAVAIVLIIALSAGVILLITGKDEAVSVQTEKMAQTADLPMSLPLIKGIAAH